MDNRTVNLLGVDWSLGSLLDVFLIMGLAFFFYANLYFVYRVILRSRGRVYDKRSIVHLIVILPLALLLSNMTKSLYF